MKKNRLANYFLRKWWNMRKNSEISIRKSKSCKPDSARQTFFAQNIYFSYLYDLEKDRCFCWFPVAILVPSEWPPIATWRLHKNKNLSRSEEKAFPHILHKKNCSDLNLGERVCIVPSFFSQILNLVY